MSWVGERRLACVRWALATVTKRNSGGRAGGRGPQLTSVLPQGRRLRRVSCLSRGSNDAGHPRTLGFQLCQPQETGHLFNAPADVVGLPSGRVSLLSPVEQQWDMGGEGWVQASFPWLCTGYIFLAVACSEATITMLVFMPPAAWRSPLCLTLSDSTSRPCFPMAEFHPESPCYTVGGSLVLPESISVLSILLSPSPSLRSLCTCHTAPPPWPSSSPSSFRAQLRPYLFQEAILALGARGCLSFGLPCPCASSCPGSADHGTLGSSGDGAVPHPQSWQQLAGRGCVLFISEVWGPSRVGLQKCLLTG